MRRDFPIALGVYVLLALWTHRGLIAAGQVNSFSAALPGATAIRNIPEMVYQEPPAQWTAARIVRSGTLPTWTPYPHGGTPLLAKMQNGVFSPFHLHYYLVPDRWMPLAFTLVPVITGLFGYCLVYLFGRMLSLGLVPAILAAVCHTYFTALLGHALFSPLGSGLFLPLLLALAELHLQGRKAFALVLVPAACALPFFVGHMESAGRIQAGAFLYLGLRLLQMRHVPAKERAGLGLRFVLAAGFGDLAALSQIVPGLEYHAWSYNAVWRGRPEYNWVYHTIQKHLTPADLPLLAAGLASLYGSFRAWRYCLSRPSAGAAQLGSALAAAAALAAAIAGLWAVGLDDTVLGWSVNARAWPAQAFLLFFSLWLVLRPAPAASPALKALAALFVGSLAVELKLPPLSNLLAALPVLGSFNNTVYTPDFDLSRCVLAAAALQDCAAPGLKGWRQRLAAGWPAVLLLAILALGYAASRPLKRWAVARAGIAAWARATDVKLGFQGPEQLSSFPGAYPVAGVVPPGAPVKSVHVADLVDKKPRLEVPAAIETASDGRTAFRVDFPVAEGLRQLNLFALVTYHGKAIDFLAGPKITVLPRPGTIFLVVLALLPLLVAAPRWLRYAAHAAAAAAFVATQEPVGVPAGEFPFRLPGIESLDRSRGPFRVDSFAHGFLQADYANLYGLQDIRNGGDNLDLAPMMHFLSLRQDFWSRPEDRLFSTGMRLEGLANVRYVFDLPESLRASPSLEEHYRGPDMAVYRNKHCRPRARFFEQSVLLPAPDPLDFEANRKFTLSELRTLVADPGFDMDKTLVLHDSPQGEPAPAAAPSSGGEPSIEFETYAPDRSRLRVDAPRAGFVFLGDNHFPGWVALLDGRPARILRSWLTFRAVAVPAGKSVLEFRYRPGWLAPLFGLTALLALAWAAAYLRCSVAPDWLPAGPPAALPEYAWLVELVSVALVLPSLIYWTFWSGFVYEGGLLAASRGAGEGLAVNAAACAALALLAAGAAWSCRRRFLS
ncbi:MAG: hypothetical protein HY927_00075 [Elusimicrobia bacterium]|nr:hypothetical protein [Elusimicrobiota bacterium]